MHVMCFFRLFWSILLLEKWYESNDNDSGFVVESMSAVGPAY